MKLTEEQVEIVKSSINSKELKIKTLREDVIDHLCCVIEYELKKGKVFEHILNEAIIELAPNGLTELERKTIFLLNTKRILIMKKLMYIIGFIGAAILATGITFKLLYMPWGYEFFITGFLILFLVFIPLLAFDKYKVAISRTLSERLKINLGLTAGIIIGLSGLFKVLHLQGTNVLLLLGVLIFTLGFLPFFFFAMYKKSVS